MAKKFDYSSPVIVDYDRVVKIGKDGEEIITYEPVDYAAIIKSHGTVDMWSLSNLLKAGVNVKSLTPNTTVSSRIELADVINDISKDVDAYFASQETNTEDIK